MKQPHMYRGWVLTTLVILYVISLISIVLETIAVSGAPTPADSPSTVGALGGFAATLLIVFYLVVPIRDARGFFSLYGRFQWSRLIGWQKVLLVFTFLCILIMPAAYLFVAIRYFLGTRRQTAGQAVGSWFRRKSVRSKIALLIVSFFLIVSYIAFTASMTYNDRTNAFLALTPTATPQQLAQSSNPTETPVPQDAGVTVTVDTTAPTVIPTATATTPTPTPIPTHSPTPRPTPKPTQPPITLSITFTCASAVDYSYGQVCVHTLPGAALTITVTYCTEHDATSDSLKGTFYANGGGNYTWYWTPETKCRGTATASVDANWNGQNTSNTDNFTVQ